MRLVWSCLVLVLASVGCKKLETEAKENFAAKYSCPEDRIAVKARQDLNADEVLRGKKKLKKKDTPPAEVAADPARLAKWNQDHAEAEESRAAFHSNWDVFEVNGCSHIELAVCHRVTQRRGSGSSRSASCSLEGAP
jgi:hypothetical protein